MWSIVRSIQFLCHGGCPRRTSGGPHNRTWLRLRSANRFRPHGRATRHGRALARAWAGEARIESDHQPTAPALCTRIPPGSLGWVGGENGTAASSSGESAKGWIVLVPVRNCRRRSRREATGPAALRRIQRSKRRAGPPGRDFAPSPSTAREVPPPEYLECVAVANEGNCARNCTRASAFPGRGGGCWPDRPVSMPRMQPATWPRGYQRRARQWQPPRGDGDEKCPDPVRARAGGDGPPRRREQEQAGDQSAAVGDGSSRGGGKCRARVRARASSDGPAAARSVRIPAPRSDPPPR